jgi:CheY-like chemotaxis protein
MSNTRILIVEDNVQFLHTLKEYLKRLISDVVSVTDGIAALEFIKTYKSITRLKYS